MRVGRLLLLIIIIIIDMDAGRVNGRVVGMEDLSI